MASRRPTARKKTRKPAPIKSFRASDHPHRDYRGEKLVNGVKIRT